MIPKDERKENGIQNTYFALTHDKVQLTTLTLQNRSAILIVNLPTIILITIYAPAAPPGGWGALTHNGTQVCAAVTTPIFSLLKSLS